MKKTHHNQLLELHKNGDWVCSTKIEYMRDHRKRYSELSASGYKFQSEPCDGRCNTKHSSRLFMRRLVDKPVEYKQSISFKINPDGHRVAVVERVLA